MSFRYQTVYVDNELGSSYSICEVYLNDDGILEGWTEEPCICPVGNDLDDLKGCLIRMLYEAEKWEPVAHADLKVGMTFKRRNALPEPTP